MSAIRVAPFCHTLALLGVNLSENKLEEILAQDPKYSKIFLALDNDATGEAIKTQLRWRARLPHMYVLGLEQDIKNMNPSDFQIFLQRLGKGSDNTTKTATEEDLCDQQPGTAS